MLLSIAITLLTLALTMLQLLRPSRAGWDLAKVICVALLGLTTWSSYDQNQDREFLITNLTLIASRIDWDESEAYVGLITDPEEVSPTEVSTYIKLVKPSTLNAPGPVDLATIQRSCNSDKQWGYEYLSEDQAERLYRAFAREDGSTVIDDESRAGIEHLFYSGDSVTRTPAGNSRVRMHLNRGPTARTKFASLADLEGGILVALVQAPSVNRAILSSLDIALRTNAGRLPIHAPIRVQWSKSAEGFNVRTFASSRYVGICIPKGFFSAVKHGA